MAWRQALQLQDLQQQQRIVCTIEAHKILFIWHEDAVFAIQSQCPHLKLPLKKGTITEQCTIICPFHKSEFDLNTGHVECWSKWPPVIGPLLGKLSTPHALTIYPTRIQNECIEVEIK